jgi:hypothetical protein
MSERIYLVDPATKSLTAVEPVSLSSIGVKERQDLESWAVSHPEIFGEKLLVITSEFDRFDRSDRRIDILALDEDGCLVVIELKLALSGSFADQQAIRYAALCSTMTMAEVVDAHARYLNCSEDEARGAIAKFLDEDELPELDGQPRIILAGGDLDDQELTSTVLWLRTFGVDISCVEIKPYRLADGGPLLLVPRVIIPLPEARDYIIRVERKQANAAKVVKDRELRSHCWQALSDKFNRLNLDWKARARSSKNYLQIPVGQREMHYEWLLQQRQKALRVALHFESDDREVNQRRMSQIQVRSAEIRAGVEYPFVAEMWGRRWATAEFRIPWDSQLVTDEALDEAVRVMQLLVERTRADVERFKSE